MVMRPSSLLTRKYKKLCPDARAQFFRERKRYSEKVYSIK